MEKLSSIFKEAFFKRHGIASLGKNIANRLTVQTGVQGTDSLTAIPLKWLAKKITSERTVNRIGNHLNRAAISADMIAGKPFDHLMQKYGPKAMKDMFGHHEMVRIGKDKFQKVRRSSILEPASTVAGIATPMLAAEVVRNKIEKARQEKKDRAKISEGYEQAIV